MSTAACSSAITYIDGDKGELLYRGYPIEQLAVQLRLPRDLLPAAERRAAERRQQKDEFVEPRDAPHDGQRADAVLPARLPPRRAPDGGDDRAWSARCRRSITTRSTSTIPQHREISAIRLIAKMPTLVAMAYKYSIGQPFMYPRNDLSYAANFMRMMFATPCEEYKVNDVLVRALDRIFILHADHEQNASTSTVRLCGSSGTNPFAASPPASPACGARRTAAPTRRRSTCSTRSRRRAASRRSASSSRKVKDKNSGVQADGLRPPRLQELRPARQADARDLPRGARASSACTTIRCSSSRWRSRRSRSRTTTSSRASSTRTSTSIRASCRSAIGIPVQLFTGDLRARAHRRLDRAVERDDRRSGVQDRPAAPALHRRDAAQREADLRTLIRRGGRAARDT